MFLKIFGNILVDGPKSCSTENQGLTRETGENFPGTGHTILNGKPQTRFKVLKIDNN